MSDIEAECEITPRDYVQAQYLHIRPRPLIGCVGIGLAVLFLAVLGFSAIMLARDGGSPSLVVIMSALGAYLAGYFLWFIPWRARRIYAQQKSLHSPIRMKVDASGVAAQNQLGQVAIPWDHIRKWKENRHLFLLYHADVLFQMIPKRCLKSAEDINALRALLSSHSKRAAA